MKKFGSELLRDFGELILTLIVPSFSANALPIRDGTLLTRSAHRSPPSPGD